MIIIRRSNCIIQHLVSSHSVRGRPVRECDDTRCCIIQFDLLMMITTVLETCTRIYYTYYKTRICALSWSVAKRTEITVGAKYSANVTAGCIYS